jgi:mersacidin/lichenicidin family type 2 lantibiotic
MSRYNIVRAWKDAEYRHSLSEAERALLPDNPAGTVELTEADLDSLAGAQGRYPLEAQEVCLATAVQGGPSIAIGSGNCPYCV